MITGEHVLLGESQQVKTASEVERIPGVNPTDIFYLKLPFHMDLARVDSQFSRKKPFELKYNFGPKKWNFLHCRY